MVYGTQITIVTGENLNHLITGQITIVTGAYKPTNITGGGHIVVPPRPAPRQAARGPFGVRQVTLTNRIVISTTKVFTFSQMQYIEF